MDKADTVLIAIVVTTVVLAIGSIVVCVILLVLKWNQLKRRHIERICVAPAETTENDGKRLNGAGARQIKHNDVRPAKTPISLGIRCQPEETLSP